MTKSFLTATAFAALLGFGATAAVAQQNAPTLEAPAIQKSAPVDSGKAAPGTVQDKSVQKPGSTVQQGATVPAPADSKAKRDTTAAKPLDSKAKRDAAATCATIKDKAAHDACLNAPVQNQGAKNQSVKTPADQKAATPDKSKSAPRVGG